MSRPVGSFRVQLAVLLLSLVAAPASAQRLYQVEVVLFERETPVETGGEQWTAGPEARQYAGAVSLSSEGRDSVAGVAVFQALPAGQLRLSEAAAVLNRSPRHRVLLHTGWRQPSYGARSPRAVYISTADGQSSLETGERFLPGIGAGVPPSLEGTLSLRVSRFLHLDVDLSYLVRGVEAGGGIRSARLRESRRMRFTELHYLDHPLFGMLVQITPLDIAPRGGEDDSEHEPVDEEMDAEAPGRSVLGAELRQGAGQQGASPFHAGSQVPIDLGHADFPVTFSRGHVGDNRAGGVGQAQLPGQCGLGHPCHAHHVAAVALHAPDLRG